MSQDSHRVIIYRICDSPKSCENTIPRKVHRFQHWPTNIQWARGFLSMHTDQTS